MDLAALRKENADLKLRLEDAEEALRAIRCGEVDAVVVRRGDANRVYTVEGAERPYRLLVERMQQGALTLSADGAIVFANPRFSALARKPIDHLIGKPLADLLAAPDRSLYAALLRDSLTTAAHAEFALLRPDGPPVPVYLTLNPLPLDAGAAVGVLVTDLTEQVRNSETRFRSLVEQVRDYAIFLTDRDGKATSWNEGVRRVLGFEEEGFVGVDVSPQIFTPEDVAAGVPQRELDMAAATGSANDDRWMRRRDGTRFWATGITTGLFDPSGNLIGFTKVMRDQTDMKRVEQALREYVERLTLLTEAHRSLTATQELPALVGAIAREAVSLVGCGTAYVRLADAGDAELPAVGREIDDLVARTNKPLRVSSMQLLERWRAEGDDGPVGGGWLAVPLIGFNGRNLGVVHVVCREGREFTADDLALLAQLANIAAVALENAGLYAELRERDQRKDEFLATLAHELRNPLAPVRNAAQILRVSTAAETVAKAREMIDRQVGHMTRLIDDLLDVSRVSRGKVQLKSERIPLSAVIEAALETSTPLIESSGHTLATRVPEAVLTLHGDPTRLAQVVANLLNNAAKYTPDGGRIELSADREGDQAVIRVRDDGVGIPAEMLPKVFEIFTQVGRSLDRAQGGLGIGLSLVKRLVEMHGGSVEAESEGANKGATFTVRLPLAGGPAFRPVVKAPPPPPGSSTRLNVLVVDDDRDGAESLAVLLDMAGHRTRTCHGGAEALAAVRAEPPDVIFLDIGMPGLNGYEVAAALKADRTGASTTIIALTGWATDEDRDRARESGFDHHLTKPVDPAEVERLLRQVKRPVHQ